MWIKINKHPANAGQRPLLLNLNHVISLHSTTTKLGYDVYPIIHYKVADNGLYNDFFATEEERDARFEHIQRILGHVEAIP